MEMVDKMNAISKYPAYRNSGVEWLGDIPNHWGMIPNKFIFELKKNLVGKNSDKYTLLSLTLTGIVKRDMDNPQGKFPAEFDTYQEVQDGDFVFCLFDVEETPRCVGLSSFNGMITGAYTVLRTTPEFKRKFLYYFYLNLDNAKRLRPLYTGLRNTISKDRFFAFKTFIPPLQEQKSIADFLEDKTSKIDRAIAQKERMIVLLKERKQIIIQNAVTKGLDPHVKMKDSGVDWIGEIPGHYSITKLGLCLKALSEKNRPDLPLLSITRELGVIVRDTEDQEANHNFIPDDLSGYKVIRKGQFGMNKMKAWQGSYGVSEFEGIISPAYYVFDLKSDINPNFFHRAIRSKVYVPFFAAASDGVRIGQWDLNKSRMKEIPLVIPPISEQVDAIAYIENQSMKIERAISQEEIQIEKLKELRSTLIDSAVTGKIKVC